MESFSIYVHLTVKNKKERKFLRDSLFFRIMHLRKEYKKYEFVQLYKRFFCLRFIRFSSQISSERETYADLSENNFSAK